MSASLYNDYVFGAVVGGNHVDDAVVAMLQRWELTYLREAARRSGEPADELVHARSWRISTDLEKMPEDQVPGVILVNDGLAEVPEKSVGPQPPHNVGRAYQAAWRYQIGVLTSARGKKINAQPRAIHLAKIYCLAYRLIMIHKRDTDDDSGILGMMDWVDEKYDGLDSEDDRTICLAHTDFNVWVKAAATWPGGPLSPDTEPEPEPDAPVWEPVTLTEVDVTKVPIDEKPFPVED